MGSKRMTSRWAVAALAAVVVGVLLSGCVQSKGDVMTPHEARDALVSTIQNSAALLNVTGWKRDGAPGVQSCGTDGSRAKYNYGYGAPQPGPDHDHQVDAKKIADYWTSLGMTVRTVLDGGGDPVVFAEGGSVAGLMFSTAPGDYYISGTSLCVPGNVDQLYEEETRGSVP